MKKILFLSLLLLLSTTVYAKDIIVKNVKGQIIGKLVLVKGNTYTLYDKNNKNLGSVTSAKKLPAKFSKTKKYKLTRNSKDYTIKE